MAKRISTAVILALAAALGLFSDLGLNRAVLQGPRICPHDAEQVYVPAGPFLMGSTREEREYAYELDKGITRSYGWYEKETRRKVATGPFCIDRYPVTNAAYKGFVKATGHPAPFISADGYRRQGFLAHSYDKVQEFLWKDGLFPAGRDSHPVALVSLDDAQTYCDWRGTQMRRRYRLPSEEEWEKSARGSDGRIFPWGDRWNPDDLNSGSRFGSTTPVDRFPEGKSPYGVYDMAGNLFEWTATPWDERSFTLKGCSWDDLPGTCRAAMRHGRPPGSKHILIGFRCASEIG